MRPTLDRLRAARRDQSGFTLIELLIVIIILGVLAGIVVFAVRGITDNGETAACKTEFRTVETAVEAYYAKNTALPPGADNAARLGALVPSFLHDDDTEYVTGVAADGTVVGAAC